MFPRLFLRGVVVFATITAALVVGGQLRGAREQLSGSQAATASSALPSATPAPTPIPTLTPALTSTARTPQVAPANAQRTVVPMPSTTPQTDMPSAVRGTVTLGGKPLSGAQVMVYPANASNRGPTPVPPASAQATTDARGVYQVAVPPGTYRIGAFRDYNNPNRDFGDGFTWVTWYGDAFVIGLGKDFVVDAKPSIADIAILPTVRIGGRVVGRDGVGVPNAQLSLWRYVGGVQFPFGGGSTDPSGRFSLAHVAMTVTLGVSAPGLSAPVGTTVDLDLRADRSDLLVTIDRGNIVSGTLRDAAGRPMPDTAFGATPTDSQVTCGWCNGRSDASGRFTITLPTTTVRFRNWPQRPGDPELFSQEYVIAGDVTLDPVLVSATPR